MTTFSKPLISFCIPTRNRSIFLLEMLENLVAQAGFDCEYVIVDGGSQDATADIVDKFKRDGYRIIYFRREQGVGVDRDILKAVELASGEYCWLMSDDDLLEDGSYTYVSDVLRSNSGIAGASLNIVAYDPTISYRIQTVPSISCVGGVDMVFDDRDQCFSLLGLHMGFISAQVVCRKIWLAAVAVRDTTPFCNSWIIVYVIGEMLNINNKWLYLDRECIAYRSGNDSFAARLGVYGRQLITHENYAFTLKELFGDNSQTYKKIFHGLIKYRMGRTLAMIKADGATFKLQFYLAKLYISRYYNYKVFWIKVMPLFLIPNIVFRLIRWAYFLKCSLVNRI